MDSSLDTDCLYNLSSGVATDTEVADRILMTQKSLEKFYSAFVENRLESSSNKICHLIARQALSLFNNARGKGCCKASKLNKQKTIEINRNILAKFLAYTAKTGRTIDFREHFR